MLQKINIQPGFNKQVTATVARANGLVVTMFVLDINHLKK